MAYLGGTYILMVEDVAAMFEFYTGKIGLEPGTQDDKWASARAANFELGLHHGGDASGKPQRVPFSLVTHGSTFLDVVSGLRERDVNIVDIRREPQIWEAFVQDPEGNIFSIVASPAQNPPQAESTSQSQLYAGGLGAAQQTMMQQMEKQLAEARERARKLRQERQQGQ